MATKMRVVETNATPFNMVPGTAHDVIAIDLENGTLKETSKPLQLYQFNKASKLCQLQFYTDDTDPSNPIEMNFEYNGKIFSEIQVPVRLC